MFPEEYTGLSYWIAWTLNFEVPTSCYHAFLRVWLLILSTHYQLWAQDTKGTPVDHVDAEYFLL